MATTELTPPVEFPAFSQRHKLCAVSINKKPRETETQIMCSFQVSLNIFWRPISIVTCPLGIQSWCRQKTVASAGLAGGGPTASQDREPAI